ncbi:MAG: hypothetical protein CVV58_04165, partial [Tenericutes bacterium HGW-Tenericutes-3]
KGTQMKNLKRILLVLLLVFAVGFMTGCKADETDVTELAGNYFTDYPETGSYLISWTDLYAKMDAGDEPFILSIRSNADYTTSHIEGAYNAAWGTDLASKVEMLPKDTPVYVYCYSGQTAGQTIALLRLLGIDAYSVKSGFVKGGAASHPEYLETTANELPDANAEFDQAVLDYVKAYFNAIPETGNHIVSATDAKVLIDAGDVSVVDIRSAADFALGHIEGAINIPFGKGMESNFSSLPDGRFLVACYSGQTAGQTVAILRAMGHNADSISYGMSATDGWVKMVKANAANLYFSAYPASGSHLISWTDLLAKVDADEDLFVLDIRSAADYALGHLDGAINAPWGADLGTIVSQLPKDQTVYVYCYSGQTAGQAIALLNLLGIDAVSVKSGAGTAAANIPATYISTVAATLTTANATFDPFILSHVVAYFNAIATEGSHIVDATAAKTLIDAGTASVVDIRSAADFALGHIDGAVNIPFGLNMQASFNTLPAGKLLVVCYSGQTAGQTIAVLRTLGYDADSIKSGMNGWNAAFPTT